MSEIGYKYYSRNRGVSPGTFPRPEGNEVVLIHNYSQRVMIATGSGKEIPAWGWIIYKKPLSEKDISDYELVTET